MKNIRMKALLLIAVLSLTFVSSASALKIGNVENSVNAIGQLNNQGDVKFTKIVSKTDEEGVYEITLSAQGVNKVETSVSQVSVPVYVVVVLDRSASMYGTRWNNAVEGAKSFATTLHNKYNNAQIALVTFSTNVEEKRGFEASDFASVDFGSTSGNTNLAGAIEKATDLLSGHEANAKLYMVILSDGVPCCNYGQEQDVYTNATTAKTNGIEIFTIGYEANTTAKSILKQVANDDNHFVEAETTNIVNSFNNIVSTGINVESPAGTNAVITDTIGSNFTLVDSSLSTDGKTVIFNVGDITSEVKTFTFKVRLNDNLTVGTYNTNESATITYIDINSEVQAKTITNSSSIAIIEDDVVVEEIPAPKTGIVVDNEQNNLYVIGLIGVSITGILLITRKLIKE